MEYFLQTEAWADFQRSLGRRVHQRSGRGWSFLAIEEKNPAGKVLYAPYGPVAESVAAFDDALAALAEVEILPRSLCPDRACDSRAGPGNGNGRAEEPGAAAGPRQPAA